MDFIVQASTDIGNTKQNNQDSLSVKVISTPIGKMVFAVLCDGMGGLEKGELASATVVSAFNKWALTSLSSLCSNKLNDADIRNEWTNIAVEYNQKIKNYGKSCAVNLGTTATAMLITESRFFIINIGDTRAYELYDKVSVLTKDQTVVAREIELGNITEEQAKTDSRRSVLLQCIGASDTVYPDMFFGDTKKDAVYMLCSDGFIHEITTNEIYMYLQPNQMTSADNMKINMDTLIHLNKQRQERDNISVITIRTF